jgi:hypothetical protein
VLSHVLVIRFKVKRRGASLVVILLAFSGGAARAADADPAALAYQRAMDLYASGDLGGALASMRESFRLSGRAELLYNIARLESEAGQCAESLADYRQYLKDVPRGRYRDAATRASEEQAARCPSPEQAPVAAAGDSPVTPSSPAVATPTPAGAAGTGSALVVPIVEARPAAAAPTPLPAHEASAEDSGDDRRWIGWSAIAAGALVGIGSIYFTASAYDARSRLRDSIERERMGGPYYDPRLEDEQHRDERWAQILGVTSGALLGGGVVILLFGAPSAKSGRVTTTLDLGPSLASARLSTAF